jgi:uncharacterized phage-associated protein
VVRADDVAAYILGELGPMSAMKLQKLAYYSQAWHVVWEEEALFPEQVEAWANGPVVPALYEKHRGLFTIVDWPDGNAHNLAEPEATSVDAVLEFYGHEKAVWLSELTHREDPWVNARVGLGAGERGNEVIPLDAMAEYYSALV